MAIERLMLARLYKLDHLYGLLLTFGLALIVQGLFRNEYGHLGDSLSDATGAFRRTEPRFHVPAELPGLVILASIVTCLATWFVIERTSLGRTCARRPRTRRWCRPSHQRARMITLTYGFAVALAAFAGVMAAPIYQSIRLWEPT